MLSGLTSDNLGRDFGRNAQNYSQKPVSPTLCLQTQLQAPEVRFYRCAASCCLPVFLDRKRNQEPCLSSSCRPSSLSGFLKL